MNSVISAGHNDTVTSLLAFVTNPEACAAKLKELSEAQISYQKTIDDLHAKQKEIEQLTKEFELKKKTILDEADKLAKDKADHLANLEMAAAKDKEFARQRSEFIDESITKRNALESREAEIVSREEIVSNKENRIKELELETEQKHKDASALANTHKDLYAELNDKILKLRSFLKELAL